MAVKFSVIIPSFNRGHCIKNAVESSLAFLQDGEIIVVDDGSTDNTEAVLRRYIDAQKILYIKTPSNLGANAAKNKGAMLAKGEWLIFQDSDDFFTVDAFLHINSCVNRYFIDTALIFFACLNEDGKSMSSNPSFNGFVSFEEYIKSSKVSGEYLPVVKKDIFLQNVFYDDISGGEGIIWATIIKKTSRAFFCSDIARIYNDIGTDRLSYKKNNLKRLYLVFKKDISIFFADYLASAPGVLAQKLTRLCYYFIASKIQKSDKNNG